MSRLIAPTINVFSAVLDIIEGPDLIIVEVRQSDSDTRVLVKEDTETNSIIVDCRYECDVLLEVANKAEGVISETVMIRLAMLEHAIATKLKRTAKVSYKIRGRNRKYVIIDVIIKYKLQ